MSDALRLAGQRVLVVGLARSGVAAARVAHARGAQVTVTDRRAATELGTVVNELGPSVELALGGHDLADFTRADLIVVSPGVPLSLPEIQSARRQGVPVLAEVELAVRLLPPLPLIGITGTNGKSTTTALTGALLGRDRRVFTGGNLGTPLCELVLSGREVDALVLELSSFQLEGIDRLRPKVAALLNVTPDHLDRHHTFENYAAAKSRIFENQTAADYVVLNADDATCFAMAPKAKAPVYWFSRQHPVEHGAFVRGDDVIWHDAERELTIMPVAEIGLKGAHNVENVLAGVCAGMLAGVDPGDIRRAVAAFKAVEHRLEFVATIRGVDYYNDSKATNVDATIKALESFPGGIHLILGGKDKGSDYAVLNPLLQQRVKRVYTIGAAAPKIESQIKGVPIVSAGTIDTAVRLAGESATADDIILLAPACASFDQFVSYEHRGRVFKDLVRQMESRELQHAGGKA